MLHTCDSMIDNLLFPRQTIDYACEVTDPRSITGQGHRCQIPAEEHGQMLYHEQVKITNDML